MDGEYFLGGEIPPPLHSEPSFPPSSMATWQSLTSAPESNCFLHPNPSPNWEKSTEQYTDFESALSSMVSSAAASNSGVFSDGFAIRELIGKLGTICNAGEISPPPSSSAAANSYRVEENLPNFRKSIPPNPVLTDPGFAERAAKFSCFGSRSFNCRTNQLGMNSTEFQYRSNTPLMGIGNLPRSPVGVQENKNSDQTQMEFSRLSVSASNSNEDSYISEPKSPNDLNSRKRKAVPRGKAKELAANATKEAEADDDLNAKRSKLTEISGKESGNVKKEEETKGAKTSPKPPEPPKDYIHVRARRGQATDSHSLAERVRREKISERMKFLQDLVPGCNKVTGKAPMLDEIINYVQSLQHQVEFLSMKLATVNPRLDFNMDSLLSKDIFQPNGTLAQPNYYVHQSHQTPQVHTNISSGAVSQSSVDPLDVTLCPNLGMQLPPVDGFGEGLPQFPSFCEDDLQSIIRMGFGENPNRDTALPLQTFAAPNQTSHTKIEL